MPGVADIAFQVHYFGIDDCHRDNLPHAHSFFEVCYVESGQGEYVDRDQHVALEAGTFFVSRPGVSHQIRSRDGLGLVYVAFSILGTAPKWSTMFAGMASDTCQFVVSAAQDTPTALLWRALVLCAAHRADDGAHLRMCALALLMSFPLLFCPAPQEHTAITPGSRGAGCPIHPVVERTVQFVRDNLGGPLKLAAVASQMNVSPRHLTRLFVLTTGKGFSQWVAEQRLALARQLLADSTQPIKDIAVMTGYSSVHYFTRVFTRESDVTPAAYRRKHTASQYGGLSNENKGNISGPQIPTVCRARRPQTKGRTLRGAALND
jgi:AraC family L-rhamnose operon transcriptional activator RhaR